MERDRGKRKKKEIGEGKNSFWGLNRTKMTLFWFPDSFSYSITYMWHTPKVWPVCASFFFILFSYFIYFNYSIFKYFSKQKNIFFLRPYSTPDTTNFLYLVLAHSWFSAQPGLNFNKAYFIFTMLSFPFSIQFFNVIIF